MRTFLGIGVAVTLVFLMATNPVLADAAKQITGAQIKNDSVTGKDVKESSLKVKKLAGKKASKYLNKFYRVPVSPVSGVATFNKSLPAVPDGTYLVTVNVSADQSMQTPFSCQLSEETSNANLLNALGSTYATSMTINATRVVKVTEGTSLFCRTGAGTFSSPASGYPSNQVTFTRMDSGKTLASA